MSLATYLLRRVVLVIPTLFGITLVTFLVVNLAPGGPVEQKIYQIKYSGRSGRVAANRAQQGVSKEVVEAIKKQYGFDKPLWTRYKIWLQNILRLDFGRSFANNP
jgi:microcin C transport system permease protein